MDSNDEDYDDEDAFDMLHIEQQAQIWAAQKRLQQMLENSSDMFENMKYHSKVIDIALELSPYIDNDNVRKSVAKMLFIASEWFDKRKPVHDGDQSNEECAREFDWLRHVLQRQPDKFALAATEVDNASGLKFCAEKVFGDDPEYQAIVNYWKEALKD